MEYVQRALYGPKHGLSHLMADKIHLSNGDKTLCGKVLNEMWFVTGDEAKTKKEVTCKKCKSIRIKGE